MVIIFAILLNSESGTYSFWQIFGGPLATLTAVLISGIFGVILFIRGIKKDRRLFEERRNIEKAELLENKNKEREFFVNFLTILIDNVVKNARIQNDFIIRYANDLVKNPKTNQHPFLVSKVMLERFLDLDTQKILKIFFEKGIDEVKFMNLYANLDYLNREFDLFESQLTTGAPNEVLKLSNDLIKIRNEILAAAHDYYIVFEKSKIKDDLQVKVNKIINEIMNFYYVDNDGIPNISFDEKKLINPIKNKLIDAEYRKIDIVNLLLKYAKDSGDIMFSIVQFNTEYGNELLEVSKSINDACIKVEEIRNEIAK